jgi:hypothetical protein
MRKSFPNSRPAASPDDSAPGLPGEAPADAAGVPPAYTRAFGMVTPGCAITRPSTIS